MIVIDFLTSWKTGFQEPSPLRSSNFVYHVIQMVLYNWFYTILLAQVCTEKISIYGVFFFLQVWQC